MKITVQFPTFGRKDKFLAVLEKYVSMASDANELFFNINCDLADLSMTNAHTRDDIAYIFDKEPAISWSLNIDANTEKISAINDHATDKLFDIIVCASDDMVPQVYGWDDIIASEMEKNFPNLDGCIHFNDGNTNNELITFSILGRRLYEFFGYIYHPDYKSLYCDDEFTQEVKSMNKYHYVDTVLFKHEHWSIEGSENHNEVDIAVKKTLHYSGRDKGVFELRKTLGFPSRKVTND